MAAASVTVIGGPLNLGTTTAGTAGSIQTYSVGGSNLTADIVVTAPGGVELSDDGGSTWHSSLTLTESDGSVATTVIDARIGASVSAGTIGGSIANASTAQPSRMSPSAGRSGPPLKRAAWPRRRRRPSTGRASP